MLDKEPPIIVEDKIVQQENLEFAYSIIQKFLNNELSNVNFRSVPEIMTQAVLYKDKKIEIRLHDFSEVKSDTYIHNHANPFNTICLEGGYEEKLWGQAEGADEYFFEFERGKNGKITLKEAKSGKLVVLNTRLHSPGNKLATPSSLFHSIGTKEGLANPFTLILKVKGQEKVKGKVFGEKNVLTEPTTPIQSATQQEIESLKDRTNDLFKSFLNKQKYNNL